MFTISFSACDDFSMHDEERRRKSETVDGKEKKNFRLNINSTHTVRGRGERKKRHCERIRKKIVLENIIINYSYHTIQ